MTYCFYMGHAFGGVFAGLQPLPDCAFGGTGRG
jgi:hypothetical protein